MSYTLTSDVNQNCLKIVITGEWPHDHPEEILTDIRQLWLNNQYPLLLDIREMIDDPTVTQDFELAILMAHQKFREIGPIAFLDNTERLAANQFLEITSNIRAIQIKFFYTDEQEAIAWLLQGS